MMSKRRCTGDDHPRHPTLPGLSRRRFLRALGALAAGLVAARCSPRQEPEPTPAPTLTPAPTTPPYAGITCPTEKRNIIILHADQQRYDSMGCTGNEFAVTPNLDRLAAASTVFTCHVSANTVCMPSRASLMTGLYPPGHNVWSNGVALPRREYGQGYGFEPATLADVFAAAGYDTAAFGKTHFTPTLSAPSTGYPESVAAWNDGHLDDWHGPYYGFRHVELTLNHGLGTLQAGHYARWLEREHPDVYNHARTGAARAERPVSGLNDLYASPLPADLHYSAWLAGRLCEYLENGRAAGQPFLAFVGFPDPHHPFTPSYDVLERFEGIDVKEPCDPTGECAQDHPTLGSAGDNVKYYLDEERRTIIRYTYALVYQIDLAVGRILDRLEELGLWDDTIVIFTGDHGDYLCDHGRLRKSGIATDALLHLPFLMRAPGADWPAQIDAPMGNCDVLPTLAALTGVEPPDGLHGQDMCSVLRSGEPHQALAFCPNSSRRTANYTIYDGPYRYTTYPRLGFDELYDHRSDPGECANLAGESGQAERVAFLKRTIEKRMLEVYDPHLGRAADW
jgi:arylsulfatase A-like enzyme